MSGTPPAWLTMPGTPPAWPTGAGTPPASPPTSGTPPAGIHRSGGICEGYLALVRNDLRLDLSQELPVNRRKPSKPGALGGKRAAKDRIHSVTGVLL